MSDNHRVPSVAGASGGGIGHPDTALFNILNAAVLSRLQYEENNSGIYDPFKPRIDVSGLVDSYDGISRLLITGNTNIAPSEMDNFYKHYSGNLSKILSQLGYDGRDARVHLNIRPTSKDLLENTQNKELGIRFGDSRIVTGFSTDETEKKLPLSVSLLQDILDRVNKEYIGCSIPLFHGNYKMELLVDDLDSRGVVVSYQAEALPENQEEVMDGINKIISDIIAAEDGNLSVDITPVLFYNGGREPFDIDKGDRSKPGITGSHGYGYNAPGGGIGGVYPHPDFTACVALRSLLKNAQEKYGANSISVTGLAPITRKHIRPFQIIVDGSGTPSEYKAEDYIANALKGASLEDIIPSLELGSPGTHEILLETDPFNQRLPWEKETGLWE